MSKFIEKQLPPFSNQEFWAKELYDLFYGEDSQNNIEAVKRVRCRRLAKELATGTRTVLNESKDETEYTSTDK